MQVLEISGSQSPSLGDIRALTGGEIYLFPTAREREDWPRYIDALASAIAHGVSVKWVTP
ncbi:hypothetical protein [Streptomyces auratus]|uniref:Uncharacterized protein n=1 Tax=Streptomyces auratus AGR0001 TaxID=1160718 RepID=A0A8B1NS18_9ACTN|nr:hypothetical protein [Streptomyces auratus]QTZ93667.1 hypothetical protein SU9_021250 [Streptomyces auratus AGR0001]